ncbi:hypothetical protein SEVIR_2G448200v4 [Setaria viridis]|uniref:Uncharacterized protein n=1 Tax=Setaria viridis TaxID=4556 RepID=A0A4U6W2J9_SETVI|nr:hypothetical protein SEVIR_2G448200v2 [Setaria viridis]TKW36562.1 hypothetical protein SEVIR_2G448200v2 [Setaria viridis]TKW36563.1 hypothetical protein SEVIR_2G448200v2 [Setaria viridis]
MADEYLDDDEFDDYNPHPYAGGYDISATYGSPLPPSPATCYPVSSPAAVPAPTAPQPRSPLPHQPSPRPQPPAPAQPRPSSPPPPVAEPYYWPKPYDYGDAPRYQPAYATPEVFRGWPFLPGAPCRSACGRDYWRQCMRGLDYLFGHSDGYGERRIGVDCLGVPVYANRKGGVEDAVVVEVAPPATGTVEWHDTSEEQYYQSNRLSWYGNTEEETYAYAQPTYPSYDSSYEQSYGVSDETTWFPNQSYQEVYNEEESQYQQEFFSYNEDSKISSQPIFSYNQHVGEEPLHFHVEPPETVSSHKLEYYENFSIYNSQNNVDNLESLGQLYEIQPYMHMPYDQLEPCTPSWSLNPGYYRACTEGMAMTPEYDNHTLASGDCWDMSSLFMPPFYPQDIQVYEQSHGDENV